MAQDNLVDLLLPEKMENRPRLEIKKDTKGWVTVQNSSTVVVNSPTELQDCIDKVREYQAPLPYSDC